MLIRAPISFSSTLKSSISAAIEFQAADNQPLPDEVQPRHRILFQRLPPGRLPSLYFVSFRVFDFQMFFFFKEKKGENTSDLFGD